MPPTRRQARLHERLFLRLQNFPRSSRSRSAPGHPVLAPDADLKTVFAQSEWLTTVQDEGFLLEKLGGLGISPERVTLCDFFGIDALKGRNDALTLSPLSVIEDSLYAGRPRRTSPCALSAFSPHRLLLSPKGG